MSRLPAFATALAGLILGVVVILVLAAATLEADSRETGPGIAPVTDADFYDDGRPSSAKVALGQALFFDKLLSGNRNIACATCHHPRHASTDQVSLGLGTGASGLGLERTAGANQPVFGRVPRNSPALFNRGAREFATMFHDGRVEQDANGTWPSGFWTPAREQLPAGLDNVLAAQAMFPVLSSVEMAGHKGENEIADAVAANRLNEAWNLLAARLRTVPAYVALFRDAYREIATAEDISFVHAANAIAAFEATAFRADASPFDRYLRSGDTSVLGTPAERGMQLFYGKAGCSSCHSGPFQTDQAFHAVAMPQIGPGKGDGADESYWQETGFPVRLEDRGRYRVTYDSADLYKFRTPSLRNVELTGPWGHAGAYASLEAVVRHMLDPVASLDAYAIDQAILATPEAVIAISGSGATLRFDPVNPARLGDYRKRDGWVQATPALRGAIAAANELPSRALGDDEIDDLIAFLKALTDPTSRELDHLVPAAVPSGLPVAD
ncbi:cytochrome-c peroxidase [Halomonas sp. M20]|uniref:cytochrome-c peroxidase n=1 Tax=Halomonas sp. M20 TaxID=2763264 RepID=UPI001D0BC15D|nr:cytochrome c peroxidase [Halomonas sp. M20]